MTRQNFVKNGHLIMHEAKTQNTHRSGNKVSEYSLRPLIHAQEIGALTSTPDAGASLLCRCTTSNFVDCLRDPLEDVHPHEKVAPASGVEFRPLVPCVKGLNVPLSFRILVFPGNRTHGYCQHNSQQPINLHKIKNN